MLMLLPCLGGSMASVERTAYPILPSQLPAKELHRSYSLSDSEIEWVNNTAKSPALSIGLAIQLKVGGRKN